MSYELHFSRVGKNTKSGYEICHVCPPIPPPPTRMKKLDSRWTDFHEILHLTTFSKVSRGDLIFLSIWQ